MAGLSALKALLIVHTNNQSQVKHAKSNVQLLIEQNQRFSGEIPLLQFFLKCLSTQTSTVDPAIVHHFET